VPVAPHNVVIFVADGLRPSVVSDATAPNMAALARQGVVLTNGHAVFPTVSMPNASAIATGHYPGDTGVFGDGVYAGFALTAAEGSSAAFIEDNSVLGELDKHFDDNFLHEDTIFKLARDKGYSTAVIGKVGTALLLDHTERSGLKTIIIDDYTGTHSGIPVSSEFENSLKLTTGLLPNTPSRGANDFLGNATTPGTGVANSAQQDYFITVATRTVLPLLKARGRPFLMVFWSSDPDGTQHNQGDSLLKLVPGISGRTSLAAVRNADEDLGRIRTALASLQLDQTTDVIVAADHGMSTIAKESATSGAAKAQYQDTPGRSVAARLPCY
jgi:predicted AlkP superfamily pyrophosphatase or phosphodiesterase